MAALPDLPADRVRLPGWQRHQLVRLRSVVRGSRAGSRRLNAASVKCSEVARRGGGPWKSTACRQRPAHRKIGRRNRPPSPLCRAVSSGIATSSPVEGGFARRGRVGRTKVHGRIDRMAGHARGERGISARPERRSKQASARAKRFGGRPGCRSGWPPGCPASSTTPNIHAVDGLPACACVRARRLDRQARIGQGVLRVENARQQAHAGGAARLRPLPGRGRARPGFPHRRPAYGYLRGGG